MRIADIWNKFYLYGTKVIVLTVILVAGYATSNAQKTHWVKRNNPNYDQRKLTYGFLMGLHSSSYQIKYADDFVTDKKKFDTVYAVQPQWSPGFVLGLIVNYRLGDY